MASIPNHNVRPRLHKTHSWWRVLLGSLAAYVVGLVLLIGTRNANLFPTVVLIGSFMVPAAYVAFFYERRHLSALTMPTTVVTFAYGGLLGVFAASILEPILLRGMGPLMALGVGLVEEAVKILGVLVIARRRRHSSALDGIILGAAAGMGFAALESMGYAFTAFMASRGSLSATVQVTLVRALFAPLGHGTWTAILTSTLFCESSEWRYCCTLRVLGAYATVVLLHALWDAVPPIIGALVSHGLAGFVGQLLVGAAGLWILARRWRAARRQQELSEREGESH